VKERSDHIEEHRDLWWASPAGELGRVCHLELPPEGFVTQHGGVLPEIQVAYESWGELNPARTNAVLVIHPLAMDLHVTGQDIGQPMGWWEGLVGPGRAIDIERDYVICPNLLGGCYGTTGPRFPAPDGDPYLDRFPLLTPLDMVQALRLFVRQIGIDRLAMVIGPSMGGMLAWEWAIEGGDEVDQVVVVAAPLETTALQIGWNWLQRRGIELDLTSSEDAAAWGQMVARGVGMLSYRSPIGLEEKFGRDWFKPPGATIGERGVFNVESWLRHQGRRSVKRFDPWTYLLYSRAMDLHDVSRERGSIVNALDRVQAKVLIVGLSSDYLYSAEEVHLGADILNHLGKRVEYAEIRSPHGHDSFLLEAEQLGTILREAHRQPRRVPTPGERAVRTVRLGILGAGRVSHLFCELLEERRTQIAQEYGLSFEVRAIADPDPHRFEDEAFSGADQLQDPSELIGRSDLDVILEVTRGSETRELVEAALEQGRPVVTTNKSLVWRHGPALERLAFDRGVRLAYHGGIAAGWPLIYAVERPLGRGSIRSIHAVLSSTCNVILEEIEKGADLDTALGHARSMKLTEPDPELDISGWDTAQKLLILASRVEGARRGIEDLAVKGIGDLDPVLVRGAPSLNLRIKLVGFFLREETGIVAGVLPTAVPVDGHLGRVRGDDNVVVLGGEETGELVYLGRGSGRRPVATALLNDLVGLFHPSYSWTGRFPRATTAPKAPRFGQFVVRRGDAIVLSEEASEGAIPVFESLSP
jgi:homoserine O-acetyltransferase